MLKIGVFGVGNLGKIHLGVLQCLNDTYEVTGFYDPCDEIADVVASTFGFKRFSSQSELIDAVDCIDIVSTTASHFTIASEALRKSKHVFIEKPVAATLEQTRILMHLAEEASVQVQIGNSECFNPALLTALPYIDRPMFIETNRLSHYSSHEADFSIVQDSMLHDIEIVLSIVKANIRKVAANCVSVLNTTPDIANVRIEFDNGCVANLTASRISQQQLCKMSLFQHNAHISIDLLKKNVEIIHRNGPQCINELGQLELGVNVERPYIPELNAIEQEFCAFAASIHSGSAPDVSIEDGLRSMELAIQIMEKLKMTSVGSFDNI